MSTADEKAHKLIENLKKRGFEAIFVSNREEAKNEILRIIGPSESVGVGGSLTIRATGVIEALLERGYEVIQHWLPGASQEKIREERRRQTRANVYLTSTNAVTEAGELVNMDTFGNRVSAMIFGPEKVIIVAGINKIVHNVDEAFKRIKEQVTPKNARRLGIPKPETLWKVSTIIHERPPDTKVTVILVNEELGF
jgi:L-lactate utilization protein LutB